MFFLLLLTSVASRSNTLNVVDLGYKTQPSLAEHIAASTCIGLFNRDTSVAGPAYSLDQSSDVLWLQDINGITDPIITPTADFISTCLKAKKNNGSLLAKGYIRYNATAQQVLLPNIITLAAVLDALPLEDGNLHIQGTEMVFDALTQFASNDARKATEWVFDNYGNLTTTLAKINPGYNTKKTPYNPPLTDLMNPGLFDYIVKERIFTMYLTNMCMPLTKDHALMEKIATTNQWPRPIAVWGYDDTYNVAGGDLFEAETQCTKEHNMGQIASNGCSNLAYWSSSSAITTPQLQSPDPKQVYNKSKTYMVLIVGDGDNLNYLKNSRKDWLKQRLSLCNSTSSKKECFPLVWSLSPHLLKAAPDWLRWFYTQAATTKSDYFVLPPSGDLYSYPGELQTNDMASFVKNTERDAMLMNTSGTVEWEWFTGWSRAMKNYYPLYEKNKVVKGLFAVNVPYMFPETQFKKDEYYKIIGDSVVFFKPREWRGTTEPKNKFTKAEYLTAEDMAAEINYYPVGTVSNIYLTSDGGCTLESCFYKLISKLGDHVEIVNQNQAVKFALQAHRLKLLNYNE